MTYRVGIGAGFPGVSPREPHYECDGCRLIQRVRSASGQPYRWVLDGKPPPKWKRDADGKTFCPRCSASR